jgi:pilus assembly protein FimV
MPPRPLTVLSIVACAAALWACPDLAWALGLAGSSGAATVGQPLDITVQARLDNGETLGAECVSADVSFGEQRVPSQAVRTAVEGAGSGAGSANAVRIRITTTVPVDEPVVDVVVGAGCGLRVSRRYLVLAAAGAGAGSNASQTVIVRPVSIAPAADPPAAVAVPSPAAANGKVVTPVLAPVVRTALASRPVAAPAVAPSPARASAGAGTSRLRMDFAEAVPDTEAVTIEQAMQAVAEAASAARAIAAAASAANQRANALETTVQQLRAQGQVQMEVNDRLRQQLASTEVATRWTWLLAATSAALLALSVWMGRRLMQLKERQAGGPDGSLSSLSPRMATQGRQSRLPADTAAAAWAAAEPPTVPPLEANGANGRISVPAWPAPAPTSASRSAPALAPGFATADSWLPTLDAEVEAARPQAPARSFVERPESTVERTDPILQSLQGARLALRDVSIDELIDLEQQADFFVALDQDDAAIALLADHLRQTGGASPLPYLKLMEIYRRRGERDEYERSRVRFNQRFNAYAPEWEVGLLSGRSLEDYPDVLPRLMQVWGRTLDSMAELEALLFRKSRGELFDLPAYREVLFLYAIARDLLDWEATDMGTVDVLLPLTGASLTASTQAFGTTAPQPFITTAPFGEHNVPNGRDLLDTPTAPVDFDLTVEHSHPTSIFDPLKPTSSPQRRL